MSIISVIIFIVTYAGSPIALPNGLKRLQPQHILLMKLKPGFFQARCRKYRCSSDAILCNFNIEIVYKNLDYFSIDKTILKNGLPISYILKCETFCNFIII